MRVARFVLDRFGPFTGQELDWSAPGVHLVVGPNEAGKSTVREALTQLLYGIDARTAYDFVHPYAELRLSARLIGHDSEVLDVVRLKRNKNSLTAPDDGPLPDNALAGFLRGVGRGDFTGAFALDQSGLRSGADALLHSGGDLGQALYESRSSTRLVATMDALKDRLEAVYVPRGQNRSLNAALAKLDATRQELNDAQLRPEAYQRLTDQIETDRKKLDRLTMELADLRVRRDRLNKLKEALPTLEERDGLRDQLAQMEAAGVSVDADTGRVLDARRQRVGQAESEEAAASRQCADLAKRLGKIAVDERLLAEGAAVDRLGHERKAVEEAGEQAAKADRAAHRLLGTISSRLIGLRPGADPEDASSYEVAAGLIERVEALRTRHNEVATRLQLAERQAEKRQQELSTIEREADGEAAADPADVDAVIAAVPADLVNRLAATRTALLARERDLTEHLGRHALPETPPAGSLPLPTADQITEHLDALQAAAQDRAQLKRHARECAKRLDRNRRDLAVILRADPPPTDADLIAARERREEYWHGLRTALLAPAAEQAAWSEDIDSYEVAVTGADEIADRIRRDAERSAQRVRLETDIEHDEKLAAETDAELGGADARAAALAADWAALWRDSGLAAPAPQGARDLRAALDTARDLRDQVRAATTDADGLTTLADTYARQMAAALEAPVPPAGDDGALAVLLARATTERDRLAALAERRTQVSRERERARDDLAEAAHDLNTSQSDMADWDRAWRELVTAHGLSGEPVDVAADLTALRELGAQHHRLVEMRDEATEGRRRVRDFTASGERTLTACGRPVPDGADLFATVDALCRDLGTQRRAHDTRDQLRDQLADATVAHEEAAGRAQQAAADLEALVRRYGLPDLDALVEAVERTRRRSDLRTRIDDLESGLAATGRPLAVLEQEAADQDRDELDVNLATLEQAVVDAEAARDAANATLGSLEKDLARLDGSSAGAEAASRHASQLAVVVDNAQTYLRLHLARELLRRSVDRYRRENQNPVIARAERAFATLTRGDFAQLVVGANDADQPTLRARRANGAEVGIGEMSEGTRDELYLALRLASLERFADAGQHMPLLLDDVFMTFDDPRTATAFRVLDEIADRFQVLVFTHHPHVAGLAREALGNARVHVHELPAFRPPARPDDEPVRHGSGVSPAPRSTAQRTATTAERRCHSCGEPLPAPTRAGRPPTRCERCRRA